MGIVFRVAVVSLLLIVKLTTTIGINASRSGVGPLASVQPQLMEPDTWAIEFGSPGPAIMFVTSASMVRDLSSL